MSEQHKQRQQKLKQKVDQRVANATKEQGVFLVITGNGKGKTTSGFGTVARAVGHGKHCAVAQFIKGTWDNGELALLAQHGVVFHVMATGFTWDTQNKETDTQAAQAVWQKCLSLLRDPKIDLVLLDELTYMISYHYIDIEEVISAIKGRPANQHVIITGRSAHRQLIELADTVSEVKNIKHAFDAGVKAQAGFDW